VALERGGEVGVAASARLVLDAGLNLVLLVLVSTS
jgi:hypothetical protein